MDNERVIRAANVRREVHRTMGSVNIGAEAVNLNDLLSHYKRMTSAGASKDVEQLIRLFGERHLQMMSGRIVREGQVAPNVVMRVGPDGMTADLDTMSRSGPIVLKFYRGRWCPYCTLELRAYQRSVDRVNQLGGRVIALSPQSEEETDLTRLRDQLTMTMVTDRDNAIAREFGLAYELDADEQRMMASLGVDLPRINGHAGDGDPAGWSLALPALYVIGPGRRVAFSFVDPDYRRRAEPDDVVSAVATLATSVQRGRTGRH